MNPGVKPDHRKSRPVGGNARYLLWTVALALIASAAAFVVFYSLHDDPALRRAAREGDAMAWLRREFRLTDSQFAAVQALHDDYAVECSDHCATITAARQRSAPAPEIAALERICVDAMTAHFRRAAALISPEQGERYLATVMPRIAGHPHDSAPNIGVTR